MEVLCPNILLVRAQAGSSPYSTHTGPQWPPHTSRSRPQTDLLAILCYLKYVHCIMCNEEPVFFRLVFEVSR